MGCAQSSSQGVLLPRPKSFQRTNSFGNDQKQHEYTQQVLQTQLVNFIKNNSNSILISPEVEDFQKMYAESGNNLQKFFQLIQERISDLYISLSKQTLQLMGENKLNQIESKIYISQQVLYTSMNILKAIAIKTNFKFDPQALNKLNALQHSMLGYMKAKYPRVGQNFVPGELMKQFKNFDLSQEPQFDILRSVDVHFGQLDQRKLTLKVKKFLNLVIQQLDLKFHVFQTLLSEKVFMMTKQGSTYSIYNRIERKIPQNVERLPQNQDTFDIKSPQIFKVIVKWVNQMQSYILNADEQIKNKAIFKTHRIIDNSNYFDYINSDEIQNNLSDIQSNLNQFKEQYQSQIQQLRKQLQLFNHNLIKILTKAERKQKYVPKREAQVIKYSMFNTKLLSWLLIQKLTVVLKKLIEVSNKCYENTRLNLDLIKFNLSDLLRALVVGNKFQLLKVFANMKKLQEEKKLKIIKIDNRLETPLNDILIIFKMADSFIICQLMLILAEGGMQTGSDKLKNIQILNRFFYDLQKSAYGVMAEVASLLGFKDNKIVFEQKINFEKITEFNLDKCQKNHPEQIKTNNKQRVPFICSQCTTYYGSYQNQFMYKECSKCNQYLCIKCIIQADNKQTQKMQQNFISDIINQQIYAELVRINIYQDLFIRAYQSNQSQNAVFANNSYNNSQLKKLFNKDQIKFLRNIAKKKNVITFKQLTAYIQTLYQQLSNPIYFTIGKFVSGQLIFISLKYQKSNGVNFCFSHQFQGSSKQVKYKYFDFLIFFEKIQVSKLFMTKKIQQNNIFMFKNYEEPKTNLLIYQIKYIQFTKNQKLDICKVFMILDFQINKVAQQADGLQNVGDDLKKQFNYQSIEQMRSNLPNLIQTQQVYNLGNEGIKSTHLDYFKRINWKNNVKSINLHNNRLQDISVLLKELPNIQKLIISKNYIKKINFQVKLEHLNKFIASNNLIQQFEGFQNASNVATLNLQSNHIANFNFSALKHPNLRIINLKYNSIQNLSSINEQNCKKLQNLSVYGTFYGYSSSQMLPKQIFLSLPNLRSLHLANLLTKSLSIKKSHNLQLVYLNQLYGEKIEIEQTNNIKKLQFNYCLNQKDQQNLKIQQNIFMQKLFDKQFPQAHTLILNSVWGFANFPKFKIPNLKQIELTRLSLTNISSLSQAIFSNLQKLRITDNSITTLPVLKLPKLTQVYIQQDSLNDILAMQQWQAPNLKTIQLQRIAPSSFVPEVNNFPLLIEFTLTGGKFKQNYKLTNPKLERIVFNNIDCQYFPQLDLPVLSGFNLVVLYNINFENLKKCKLPMLKSLTGTSLSLKEGFQAFPILNLPTLQQINLPQCNLKNIENLSLSNLSSLKILQLTQNKFEKVPVLKLQKLQTLNFYGCNLTDVSMFQFSNLPSITNLNLSYNDMKIFPILNCPKLTRIEAMSGGIIDASNLSKCKLPSLIKLNLLENNFGVLPQINFPKLQQYDFPIQKIKNIDGLQKSKLQSLKILSFQKMHFENTTLPRLDFENLIQLRLSYSNISNIDELKHSKLPQLQDLYFLETFAKVFPVLKFPKLTLIKANCSELGKTEGKGIQQIDNLQKSVLPQLQNLQLQYNKIKKLPKLKFKKLSSIYLADNQITDVSEFCLSVLPSLNTLNIYRNKITKLPIGKQVKPTSLYMYGGDVKNFSQLTQAAASMSNFYYNSGGTIQNWPDVTFKLVKIFQIQQCQLTNIDNIMKNQFPEMIQISFTNNQIVKAPKIKAQKLQKVYLNNNCLKDISQFVTSNLPQVKMISVETNQIQQVPDFPFVSIQQAFFSHNKFTNIDCLSKYKYEKLITLVLYDIKLKKICKLDMPALVALYINQNEIQSLQHLKGSVLTSLTLINGQNNKITDLSPLNNSAYVQLGRLYFQNNKIKKLTKLNNLPVLSTLSVDQNLIQNLDQFISNKCTSLYSFTYTLGGDEKLKTANRQKIQKAQIYGASQVPLTSAEPQQQ